MLPVGFNVETVEYNGVNFITWDVSGRSGIVCTTNAIIIITITTNSLISDHYGDTILRIVML